MFFSHGKGGSIFKNRKGMSSDSFDLIMEIHILQMHGDALVREGLYQHKAKVRYNTIPTIHSYLKVKHNTKLLLKK